MDSYAVDINHIINGWCIYWLNYTPHTIPFDIGDMMEGKMYTLPYEEHKLTII